MRRFEDKVVIVTGAAAGIGAAAAARFVEEGARVVLAGRTEGSLKERADALGAGDRASIRVADVSKPDDIAGLIDFTVGEYGAIDVLVNNAGSGMLGRVTTVDPAVWHHVIATDLDSIFYACRFAIPHLVKTGGSVINIASVCGVAGDYGFHAYNAAKAGVINLTRSIALDHARDGIRVNAVSPGLIVTPATSQSSPEALAKWHAAIPMRRPGQVEEVSGLIAFLASADASYITGQNFIVDGGMLAHTGQVNLLETYGM
ncbi:short-chain dehydrogenase/reductase SDR [Sphingomonas sp. MM-1]|uniref:SDR family NAD(P)-dependent oxidoreductase n=1 Tax=Sphingomonas sp. MM-1 TaxID=745310 RepID=UPI0002C0C97E|nr:SDR family oxidoreductase [Sphingomonas sp. MM-1]AGH50402.1 short-chain dehydrogenase/reductase SDR [Sphingomonas sp. MM-1]